jgi:hypothetical protein
LHIFGGFFTGENRTMTAKRWRLLPWSQPKGVRHEHFWRIFSLEKIDKWQSKEMEAAARSPSNWVRHEQFWWIFSLEKIDQWQSRDIEAVSMELIQMGKTCAFLAHFSPEKNEKNQPMTEKRDGGFLHGVLPNGSDGSDLRIFCWIFSEEKIYWWQMVSVWRNSPARWKGVSVALIVLFAYLSKGRTYLTWVT